MEPRDSSYHEEREKRIERRRELGQPVRIRYRYMGMSRKLFIRSSSRLRGCRKATGPGVQGNEEYQ
ncbi:MAG: hypothetical protein DRN57_07525 [Thermoplasmata archaeon]|nr:MAG: hypothetical protein DRN57_07525 [Thermoplasmata archaeon]